MHEYYQKSSGKLKKTMRGFLSLVRLELERITKQPYETAFEEIWRIYEHDMLGRFPYIGGDKASGTKNLTQAYMLVAMGEYLKRFGCSLEEIGRLMTLAYERRMQKTPPIAKALMGKLFRNPGLLNKMFRKKDAQNAALKRRRRSRPSRALISAIITSSVRFPILRSSTGMRPTCPTSATSIT